MCQRLSVLPIALLLIITGCDLFGANVDQLTGDPVDFEMLSTAESADVEKLGDSPWGPRLKDEGAFIVDDDSYAELWAMLNPREEEEDRPPINFDEQTVIAVHQGKQASLSYGVDVKEVVVDGEHASVTAMALGPKGDCGEFWAISYPMQLISISHNALDVSVNFEPGDFCSRA